MQSVQQTGKNMKALAHEVMGEVFNSAGEMGRRRNWRFFIKNLPHDHNLMELADECLYAMSKEQQCQFLTKHIPKEARATLMKK